jgi:transcriptional regulator
MYVPAHFAADDLTEIGAFVDRAGSADLVTFDGSRPVATLLPVIWERQDGGGYGRLLGHIALANPQWRTAADGVPALAIVNGPQAYISPSWYPSKAEHGRVVPTWNYRSVHLTGPVTFHRDEDWLRGIVTRLTERHEDGNPGRWRVTDAPQAYVTGQLRGIVGVELTVEHVEAKDKLSQNRGSRDRAAVIAALSAQDDSGARAMAALMAARESSQAARDGTPA